MCCMRNVTDFLEDKNNEILETKSNETTHDDGNDTFLNNIAFWGISGWSVKHSKFEKIGGGCELSHPHLDE